MSSADVIIARKMKSVFDRLLQEKNGHKTERYFKYFNLGEKIYFKIYENKMIKWINKEIS